MPSKKKKYNARFPAGRIKKIMQTDEEVGKVAQAVPVIISKALEMFIESLLKKSMHITQSRNAKTLTPSHMKQCILSENRFDFLKDLVKNIPDASIQEDNENNALADSNVNFGVVPDELGTTSGGYSSSSIEKPHEPDHAIPSPANFYVEQSSSRIPVIQHGPNLSRQNSSKHSFAIGSGSSTEQKPKKENPQLQVTIASKELSATSGGHYSILNQPTSTYSQGSTSAGDNLCIDEDYDN